MASVTFWRLVAQLVDLCYYLQQEVLYWLMPIGADWCWLMLIDTDWYWLMRIDPDWWSESDISENTSCKLVYNFDEKDKIIRWQYITCGSPWSASLLSDWSINNRVQNFGAIVGSQHLFGKRVRTIQCFCKTSYRDFLCFDIFKQAVQTCEQAYTSYAYGA